MEWREKGRLGRLRVTGISICMAMGLVAAWGTNALAGEHTPRAAQTAGARAVGTIKTITGNTIVVTTDTGAETTVQVPDGAKLVRIEPGAKDLKSAVPLQLSELQPGDRILVRGMLAADGKTLAAASVIAMKHEDIAAKQAHEREEWQKHGVGGLVSTVDPATGTIKISTNASGVAKDVSVQVTKQTILRRYASNSVKFDDAKPAPIDQIKAGDQLRARGTRSADGTELAADEIVSGSFRNIAGTISAVDVSTGTLTVMDLVAKKNITVKVGSDTQIRKLPAMMAQRIAIRLKGAPAAEAAGGNGAAGAAPKPAETAAENHEGAQAGVRPGGSESRPAGRPGGGGGGGDLQQLLSRIPASTLADLQKGDAVMIVTTEGTGENDATAITLLAGVEPILEASPKGGASSILTPWTMSEAPTGDTNP
ncbi:MAG: DUF5666 domain-containing protein [Candidatus Acidiferrum sp.]